MRIGFVSDTHLGYGFRTVREAESFDNLAQAIDLLIDQRVDLILHPGDFFDQDIPNQETWARSFGALARLRKEKNGGTIERSDSGGVWHRIDWPVLPMVGIHGTHEYRAKGLANCMSVLEKAGFVLYVHAGQMRFSKGSESLVVHGLGGVPEKKARDVLALWNPVPVAGAVNVLMTHQSFLELLPFGDEMTASLSFANLPPGFDLYVNGHFHASIEQSVDQKRFFVPGSTVITQMKKNEAQKPKGVWVWDTLTDHRAFFALPRQRALLYVALKSEGDSPLVLRERIGDAVRSALPGIPAVRLEKGGLLPLVRVKIKGTLAEGFSQADVNRAEIESAFSDSAIVSLGFSLSDNGFLIRLDQLREAHASAPSVEALGNELLEKNLGDATRELGVPFEELLALLSDSDVDGLLARLDSA